MTEEIITGVFDSGVGGLSVLKKLLPLGGYKTPSLWRKIKRTNN